MPKPAQPIDLVSKLKPFIEGDVKADPETLYSYSHDTSIFEVRPQVVVFPKNVSDLKKLVSFVSTNKKKFKTLSLTGRSGGSDMSGGSVNDSIILDFSKYFKKIGKIKLNGTKIEPGVFYRDFEPKALKKNLIYPTYPASKNLCAFGGMVNNNAGGEKTLKYGQTIDYVTQVKAVLSDGNEYTFKSMTPATLKKKMKQKDFEGEIYRKMFNLLDRHYNLIKNAKPKVSKNSTGYLLWEVWDKKRFNLAKLFVGSQGTLGLTTEVKVKLVKTKKTQGLLTIFLNDIEKLPQLINTVLESNPDTFEVFDDETTKLAIRFMPQLMAIMGPIQTVFMGFQFLPMLGYFAAKGIPKFTFLAEFEGDSEKEIADKIDALNAKVKALGVKTAPAKKPAQAERYKVIRRESFNLLRKNVKDRHSAAFIDDFIVPPEKLPDFFPKLRAIIKKYKLYSTIAGHMGDGNFHIIPLMDLSKASERAKIPKCTKEVNALILKFGGSISAEHNEGLIRGPFMKQMYGPKMFRISQQTKKIFDPQNIFNPHTKTDATMRYSMSHIRHGYDKKH